MATTFSIIMTTIGLNKQAAWESGGAEIVLAEVAVGDSSGAYYEPNAAQTALVNEKWRGNVARVFRHTTLLNRVVAESTIPADVGGFDIREIGIFDAEGDLIIVGKYPLSTKPAPGSGSEKELTVQVVKELTNVAVMSLLVDSLSLATNEAVEAAIADHEAKLDPHPQYAAGDDLANHAGDTDDPHAAAGYVKASELPAVPDLTLYALKAYFDRCNRYFFGQI